METPSADEDIEIDLSLISYGHSSAISDPDIGFCSISEWEELPIRILSSEHSNNPQNTDASIYTTSSFIGFWGNECAAYMSEKINNSILAAYRNKLKVTDETQRLLDSFKHAFLSLENNFLDFSAKKCIQSCAQGSILSVYGPDSTGSLKIISSCVGNMRTVVCRGGLALCIDNNSTDVKKILQHIKKFNIKPDESSHMVKIPPKSQLIKGLQHKDCIPSIIGLPLTIIQHGILGGFPFKKPQNYLLNVTDCVRQSTIDMDLTNDLFVVQAPAELFEILGGDQSVVDIILEERFSGPKTSAERLCSEAQKKLTANPTQCSNLSVLSTSVVFFGWHDDVFEPPCAEELAEMGYFDANLEESEISDSEIKNKTLRTKSMRGNHDNEDEEVNKSKKMKLTEVKPLNDDDDIF